MFAYFPPDLPGGYVWNLAVNLALAMGAPIGEVDAACRPLLDAAQRGEKPTPPDLLAALEARGDVLVELAGEDEAAGRALSAGAKLDRAADLFITAERLQPAGPGPRQALYAKFLRVFARGLELSRDPAVRVEIPYGDAHLSAIWRSALDADGRPLTGPVPLLVLLNGLDSTKEMLYRTGPVEKLARRGVATLSLDQPGTGEALRLHGMPAVPEAEQWASVVLDHLVADPATLDLPQRPAPDRIGLAGVSLGGYYAPRAVAKDPRWALGVSWGANHDWREVQQARRAEQGERPVPHYWDHVQWVFGVDDIDSFFEVAERMHLDGVLDGVRVPYLVTHGQHDRQIPLEMAHRTYDALVGSPDRELVVFTDRTGGTAHSSVDNGDVATDLIADWVAERIGGTTK
ncbi:MAG: alpha/beta hydrolase [Quadrisphaera sp.]